MLKTKVIKKYPNFTLLAVYKVNNDKEEYLYNTCKNISEKTASIRSIKKNHTFMRNIALERIKSTLKITKSIDKEKNTV